MIQTSAEISNNITKRALKSSALFQKINMPLMIKYRNSQVYCGPLNMKVQLKRQSQQQPHRAVQPV